jgi:hypothetical protein
VERMSGGCKATRRPSPSVIWRRCHAAVRPSPRGTAQPVGAQPAGSDPVTRTWSPPSSCHRCCPAAGRGRARVTVGPLGRAASVQACVGRTAHEPAVGDLPGPDTTGLGCEAPRALECRSAIHKTDLLRATLRADGRGRARTVWKPASNSSGSPRPSRRTYEGVRSF